MPHRWRVLFVDLLALPLALSAALLALALSLGVSPAYDSLVGGIVAFFGARAFARRSGWSERGARRVAIGSGVVTLFVPALFWLLVVIIFVVGCQNSDCFTF